MIKKNFSNKREVWRVKLAVARVRKVARTLLTLDEKDPRRLFEGINSNQLFNSSYWSKDIQLKNNFYSDCYNSR